MIVGYNPHLTRNPAEACIYIVLIGEALSFHQKSDQRHNKALDIKKLQALPYWGGDGRNHILLNLARRDLSADSGNIFSNLDTGRAIVVQSTFYRNQFRDDFDLIVPPILGPPGGDVWQECAQMLPARRKYLLSFQGEMRTFMGTPMTYQIDDADIDLEKLVIWLPKAKAGPREQPITADLAEYLIERLNMLPKGCNWLFPSPASATGHTHTIRKALRRSAARAGLDPNEITPHVLRHTVVTHLVQAGVDLPTVQRISGHKTLSMVARYANQNGSHTKAAMTKLDTSVAQNGSTVHELAAARNGPVREDSIG